MPAKIRDETLAAFVYNDVIFNEMTRKDVCSKYHFSRKTYSRLIKDCVSSGLMTEAEHIKYLEDRVYNGYLALLKKLGTREKVLELASAAGRKSAVNNLKSLEARASSGGSVTKNNISNYKKNFKYRLPYGKHRCYIGETEFQSYGERFIGAFLREYGLLDDFITGTNYQRVMKGKLTVDFYIGPHLIVEYHPMPKEESLKEFRDEIQWRHEREKSLSDVFQGKIVIITKRTANELWRRFDELGIKDSTERFLERIRRIQKMLDDEDGLLSFDFNHKPAQEDPF